MNWSNPVNEKKSPPLSCDSPKIPGFADDFWVLKTGESVGKMFVKNFLGLLNHSIQVNCKKMMV